MDAVNMYGSIDMKKAAKDVAEAIVESKMKIEGVNISKACVYIAVAIGENVDEFEEAGLTRVIPKRLHKQGKTPGPNTKELVTFLKEKARLYNGEG